MVGDVSLFPNARVVLSPGGHRALLTLPTASDPEGTWGKGWVLDLGTGTASYLSLPHGSWYDQRHILRIEGSPQVPSSIVVTDAVTRVVVRRATVPLVPRLLATTDMTLARGTPPPGAVVL